MPASGPWKEQAVVHLSPLGARAASSCARSSCLTALLASALVLAVQMLMPGEATAQEPLAPPPGGGPEALAPPPGAAPVAPAGAAAPGAGPAAGDPGAPLAGGLDAGLGGFTTQVTPADCEATNKSFWTTVGAVDLGLLLLFFLVFWLFSAKNWLSGLGGGFARFIVLLLPFVAAAGVVMGLVRPDARVVELCLSNGALKTLVHLGSLPRWQIGLIVGAAPTLVLGILAKVVHGLVRK